MPTSNGGDAGSLPRHQQRALGSRCERELAPEHNRHWACASIARTAFVVMTSALLGGGCNKALPRPRRPLPGAKTYSRVEYYLMVDLGTPDGADAGARTARWGKHRLSFPAVWMLGTSSIRDFEECRESESFVRMDYGGKAGDPPVAWILGEPLALDLRPGEKISGTSHTQAPELTVGDVLVQWQFVHFGIGGGDVSFRDPPAGKAMELIAGRPRRPGLILGSQDIGTSDGPDQP